MSLDQLRDEIRELKYTILKLHTDRQISYLSTILAQLFDSHISDVRDTLKNEYVHQDPVSVGSFIYGEVNYKDGECMIEVKLNKRVSFVIDCSGASFSIDLLQVPCHLTWLSTFIDVFKEVNILSKKLHTDPNSVIMITEEQICKFYEFEFT